MKSFYFSTAFLFLYLSVFAQNVMITNSGNPNEPSIMMNPDNPDILVAGSNLNYYYTSDNGGISWTSNILTSNYGVWGDPTLDVDTDGNFYFFHLSNPSSGNWIDRIVCQKSLNNGNSWSSGTYTGLNGTKAQDKQWSVIDRNNNNIYLTWTQFDEYGSGNSSHKSNILFSKSTDGGNSWTDAQKINIVDGDCIDSDDTVEGAVPAVGPNGEIFVSWAGPNGLVFNKSTDQGATWLNQEISVSNIPGGWDYNIPGIYRANGLPITKCDLSGGTNHGTIYINWSDQRNGTNDTDIWLVKSTDGGNSWSNPIRVNDDGVGKHQFFTWMDVDQANGNLFFVFYDRRNYSNTQTDVYIAVSQDGGSTFQNIKISESPFIPNDGIFFGDYTNIVAHNNVVRPIWTRLHSGELSIWTDVTPLSQLLSDNDILEKKISVEQFPNPASEMAYISFKLHELSNVTINIYDQNGKKTHSILKNKKMEYGKHIVPINTRELNLKSGSYLIKVFINEQSKVIKSLIIE